MEKNICVKCQGEVSDLDAVKCSSCGQVYHKWCWVQKTPNCISCGAFNGDYAAAKVSNAANSQTVSTGTRVKNNSYKEPRTSSTGTSIMNVASAVFVIGVIIAIIVGFICLFSFEEAGLIIGPIVGGLIGFSSWLTHLIIDGYGEIVNNSQKSAYYLSKLAEKKDEDKE